MKTFIIYSDNPIIIKGALISRFRDLNDRRMLTKYSNYSDKGIINSLGNRKSMIPSHFLNKFFTTIKL